MKKPGDITKEILDAKQKYEALNKQREFYYASINGLGCPDKVKLTFNHNHKVWMKDNGFVPDEKLLFVELDDAIEYSIEKCEQNIRDIQEHIATLNKMRVKK